MRLLQVDDIHHTLEGQLIEVETVAHIVVGRYGLRVIVAIITERQPSLRMVFNACTPHQSNSTEEPMR